MKLEEHLWVVHRLVTMKKQANNRSRLLRYTIAACVVKIYRRVKWTSWSRIYTTSLRNLQELDPLPFTASWPTSVSSESNVLEPTPSNPELDKQRKLERKRKEHDLRFLTEFVINNGQAREFQVHSSESDPDPQAAQIIRLGSTAEIPNILAKAIQANATGSLNGGIYDFTTHKEIGLLLPFLLEQNSLALGQLQFLLGLRSVSDSDPNAWAGKKVAAAAKIGESDCYEDTPHVQ